jgi:mitochondrial fission protein ELM1
VLGDKRGDNGQVEVIAEALARRFGWSSEWHHVEMLPKYVHGKPLPGPRLHHVDLERSDPLRPPWPDLVITCGRRPANVALWIKKQSGGHTRIVLVGRPAGFIFHYQSHFDLIVTSAEAVPAPFPNVTYISLPLMRVDEARLEAGREQWQMALATLPRPLVVFLIGGPTRPFVYNETVLERLLARVGQVVAAGGTPYLVTSRRTPEAFARKLRARLPEAARFYDWRHPEGENPYAGLLALGDRFIVTGDSISMMVEVAKIGRPLEILPLPTSLIGTLDQARRRLAVWLFQPAGDAGLRERLRVALARGLYHARLMQQARHYPRFHQRLVDEGLADWIGHGLIEAGGADRPASEAGMARVLSQGERDLSQISDRIARLFQA